MSALTAAEFLLLGAVVASAFALGAVRPWAYLSLWVAAAVSLALVVLSTVRQPELRARIALSPLLRPGLCFAAWVALQLAPVPGWPLRTLSASATARGLAFVLAALAFHVVAAAVLSRPSSRRRLTSTLAWTGFVLAFVGLAQSASGTWLIYGFVQPDAHSLPFGPFWNRNHYASYMVMIVPMTLAHVSTAYRRYAPLLAAARPRRHVVTLLQSEGTGFLAALIPPLATTVALIATTSRAGLLSLLGGLLVARPGAATPARRAWILALLLVALGVAFVGLSPLLLRFSQAADELEPGTRGRLWIWRASLAAMDGAWFSGSGFNTFPLRVRDWVMYPAAHNQYLQLLVETGLPGLLLGLWAAVACLVSARRDPWLRAALAGVLLHSFLEFGLQIPAVALLFVTLAACPAGEADGSGRLRRSSRRGDYGTSSACTP